MKKTFDMFSKMFQHSPPAILTGCCSLLKPESNQPVAVRMEGLLCKSPSSATHCNILAAPLYHLDTNAQTVYSTLRNDLSCFDCLCLYACAAAISCCSFAYALQPLGNCKNESSMCAAQLEPVRVMPSPVGLLYQNTFMHMCRHIE